jgi:hypothetical protein
MQRKDTGTGANSFCGCKGLANSKEEEMRRAAVDARRRQPRWVQAGDKKAGRLRNKEEETERNAGGAAVLQGPRSEADADGFPCWNSGAPIGWVIGCGFFFNLQLFFR